MSHVQKTADLFGQFLRSGILSDHHCPLTLSCHLGRKSILTRLRSDSQHSEDFDILQILEEMAGFSIHTANEEHRTASAIYEDAGFTGTFVNIFLFHLLSARPLSDDIDSNATFREAVRLGLLLFLACLKRRFGLYPVTFKIHLEKLLAVIEKDKDDWKELKPLKLWIIAMGLLEATSEAHITQLKKEWVTVLERERCDDQHQVESSLKDIMWIEGIHGKRYNEVKDRFWSPMREVQV